MLTAPVTGDIGMLFLLVSEDPLCGNYLRRPLRYEADHVFALSTVYFFTAVIGVFFIAFWTLRLAPASLGSKKCWQKLVSSARFLSYQRYSIDVIRWRTPSLGVNLLLTIGAVFFLGMYIM